MVSNRNLLFQRSIFRGYVSFREGTYIYYFVSRFICIYTDGFSVCPQLRVLAAFTILGGYSKSMLQDFVHGAIAGVIPHV